MRQRLLDVYVFAGLAGEHRDGGVPVVRRRDVNGVDVFPLEQPPEILIRLRFRTGPFLGTLGVWQVNIGRRAVLDTRRFAHQSRDVPAAAAATDQPDDDAIVRPNHALRR